MYVIVVIGGGIAGTTTAYFPTKASTRVERFDGRAIIVVSADGFHDVMLGRVVHGFKLCRNSHAKYTASFASWI